jgi:hypothetical protein
MDHQFSAAELLEEHVRLLQAFDYMIERLSKSRSEAAIDVRSLLIQLRGEQEKEIPLLYKLANSKRRAKRK